jgi:hypothetical protein
MGRGSNKKTAVKRANVRIVRSVLVGISENEGRPLLDEVEKMVIKAKNEVPQTILNLRHDYGISLPALSPDWDRVPTAKPTASQTIAAFQGNKSEVRVTLHLDEVIDDTATIKLVALGISHLIGISISSENRATWQSFEPGGMIAVIDSPIAKLSSLLHDILLDMAMIHAKAQPWTGMREKLNSHVIATFKAQFVEEMNLLDRFAYKTVGKCRYYPLAAFARKNHRGMSNSQDALNLNSYVDLWTKFTAFVTQNTNLQLPLERENLASQIISVHANGGQISPMKLRKRIETLEPGHYCLYFLTRRAATRAKISELSPFFHMSNSHFRTQQWVICPRDKHARQAAILLQEKYINIFPFYVGESDE